MLIYVNLYNNKFLKRYSDWLTFVQSESLVAALDKAANNGGGKLKVDFLK
jgi:hypothetical protein